MLQVRGRRPGRRVVRLGVLGLVLAGVAVVVIGLRFHQWPGGPDPDGPRVPGGVLTGILWGTPVFFWVTVVIANITRSGVATLGPGGELGLSWLGGPVVVGGGVTFGRWVEVAPLHTMKGMIAFIPYGHRTVKIGGLDHDGLGYRLDVPSSTKCDFWLDRADFDRLLAHLNQHPDPVLAAEPVVDLIGNTQRPRGLLRMMAPWLITIAVLSGFGVFLGLSGLGDQIDVTPRGRFILASVTVVVVLLGILWTALSARGAPSDVVLLHLRPEGVVLTGPSWRPGELARADWTAVSATIHTKSIASRYGRSTMAVLDLRIAGHKPLLIGAWTAKPPKHATPTRHNARYMIGTGQWQTLLTTLRRHHRVR
ncbi:hypothetical protein [Actinocrispum sp. NPDC049592]|uniref:hypothetical protein n=1 Tax=Actinocrispum sp. NPDC049592 TaxID=3154835 RepID=UPI00342412BD